MMAAEVDEVEVKVAKEDILSSEGSPKKQLASIQKTMSLETGELDASDGGVSSAGASDEEGLRLEAAAGKKTSELSFVMVRLASDISSEPADSEHSGQLVPEVPRGLDADGLVAAFDKIADDAVAPTSDKDGLAAVKENKIEMVQEIAIVVRVSDDKEPDAPKRDEVEMESEQAIAQVNHPENKFVHEEQNDESEAHEVEPDEYEGDDGELGEDELGEDELDEDELDEDALDEDEVPASSDDNCEFIEGNYENTLRKRHAQNSNDDMSDDRPSDELILPEPSNILEEVWMSVFTPGVNSRVVMVMDVCFYALFFVFFGMLVITGGNFHVIFLILITACLFISVKWFIAELRRAEADTAGKASKDEMPDSGDAGCPLGQSEDHQNGQQETNLVEAIREKKEN
ncbi:ER protein Pkr1-domain-containing protein [Chytriomyces cf. hyalinus JEL632]|nr:ER protein Pkr1-domain-containing protein [Chytriomyces cf. hyalinus JEL632]